eukprot:7907634-Ditylum_brightwellii.AAC.1
MTYCIYGKRFSAKEVAWNFVDGIRNRSNIGIIREHIADDVENPRYLHGGWMGASGSTRNVFDQQAKEPRTLLFYRGAVYELTFNDHRKFSQSQIGLLFDIPPQCDLERSQRVKIFVASPGIKEIEWNEDTPNSYLRASNFSTN